jgi:hypothetical protein
MLKITMFFAVKNIHDESDDQIINKDQNK